MKRHDTVYPHMLDERCILVELMFSVGVESRGGLSDL
jgi:hypothetical protein